MSMKKQTYIAVFPFVLSIFSVAIATAQTSGKTVSVDGADIYFEEHGSGEPLVLLHGFGGTGKTFETIIPELAQQFRLIVPDLRGHGRSTNMREDWTNRQAALDIVALLDHLDIDKYSGLGTSAGAMILLHMAVIEVDRTQSIVLISGTTYYPETAREVYRNAKDPNEMSVEELAQMAEEGGHIRGAEQMRAIRQYFSDFQFSYDDMNFTPPYLSTIRAKTLIIHGDRDRFFPVSIAVEMYQSMPNAYLWVVPYGGHGNPFRRPGFMETILPFLQGKWGKT